MKRINTPISIEPTRPIEPIPNTQPNKLPKIALPTPTQSVASQERGYFPG